VSARFLFCCWPFEGHLLPQMSIAAALRAGGAEVAFYTAPERRALVESQGPAFFGFERVGPAWERTHAMERSTGGRRQSLRVQRQAFREWLVETIPDQVADLRAVIDRWRPDVLVSDLSMWGPIVVLWEAVPIPVALSSTFMGPLIPGPDAPPWGFGLEPPRSRRARAVAGLLTRATDLVARGIRRRIDEFRAANGLPPMGCSVNAFTGRLPLYLVPSLPELDYGRRDLSDRVHYTGYCLWHPPEEPGSAAWLDALPTDRPWVHVTEGTSHYQEPFVLRAAAQGLAGHPVEAILTTGRARDPEALALAPPAPNVHVARWLSHAELLPRCRAVVTTGGPATIMAALRAGVPLVVVPTTWDKPDNARRVVEAGVGIRLSPRRCTPERLRAAVERVLEDPRYRAAAQQVARRLAEAPGPAAAAELLHTLVPHGAVIR
jgi:UDP:flavonoid glycosyltransferase YjiC (YdhE family)